MVDFSTLLRKPAGEAKKPPALPIGDYPGVIKSYELGDQNKNKTPYVRFHVSLLGWADSIPESERQADLDLSKRQMRRDYFLTEDALWRLDELLRGIGVKMEGRSYEETLPDAVGAKVVAEVKQYFVTDKNTGQQTGDIGNQIGLLKAS